MNIVEVHPTVLRGPSIIDMSIIRPFCEIDTPGGHFWSRRAMVIRGIELFTKHKASMEAQGIDTSSCVPPYVAVMNSQACTIFNVEPRGQA